MYGDYVHIRLYGELQDFIKARLRKTLYCVPLKPGSNQLKDTIESLGIPHCEVDSVTINGVQSSFRSLLNHQDKIEVFSAEYADQAPESLTRPPRLTTARFIIDCNLGRLNDFLRSLGFDCLFDRTLDDPALAEISAQESRILLTRDVELLKRAKIVYGRWIRSVDPHEQVREVIRRFHLWPQAQLLSRCIDCNLQLDPVEKSDILHRLEPKTILYFDEFLRCPACEKIFWEGSHYERIRQWYFGLRDEFEKD